jgi:mono/diheme cytochrome c family protein
MSLNLRHLLAATTLGAVTLVLGACDLLGPKRSPGEKLYRARCADCHGLDGAGNTPLQMGNAYADLLDDSWRHVSGDAYSIEMIIKTGIFAKMPANPDLTDEQLRQLTDWVLHLRGERR